MESLREELKPLYWAGRWSTGEEKPEEKMHPAQEGLFYPPGAAPYTEHSEDTSGSQQLQTPLIVGGVVFLIGVHHGDIEGAGLARGQELVLRGRRGRGG